MEYDEFVRKTNLTEKTELEKLKLTAFFCMIENGQVAFNLDAVLNTLKEIGCPISNTSRLKKNMAKSKDFKKFNEVDYLLTPPVKSKLYKEYSNILYNAEEVESCSEVLDENLFLGKRGFLDKLIKQINNCYRNNCYDACAVLMRRTFEIVLILSYENLGIQHEIKDNNGDFMMLEKIVTNAVQNRTLQISRSRKEYDQIRDLGNFAAHKIHFNTRKSDIDDIKQIYRVCLEELYYKAGLLI